VEAQKRMSNGLEFQTSYGRSKQMDQNSELFAGCSTIGASNAPYYYTTNAKPQLEYGRGSADRKHSFKFSATYEVPFFKNEKGFVGHALGGWHLGTLIQVYSGHPVGVWDGRTRNAAKDANGNKVLDSSGIPVNLGGDYNLDGVANDRPVFVGKNLKSVYSHGNPVNGIFKDNNIVGCDASWVPSNVAAFGVKPGSGSIDGCNARYGVAGASNSASAGFSPGTPNSLFVTPAYPSSTATYERFGTLGRNVFEGPRSIQWDQSLGKTFKITEAHTLDFRAQAQNLANHPNFDCVTGNLSSGTFGQATCLSPFGLGEPKSRVMSLGLRYAF